jgi:hypothetical protein
MRGKCATGARADPRESRETARCDVGMPRAYAQARSNVLSTKELLLAGSWAAIVFAVIAMSGFTGSGTSQILLASGAVIALVLTRNSRRD